MLKLLSEPLPPRCPTADAAFGQLLVQTFHFGAICDPLLGGKRIYTSGLLSPRHIWQGLAPQRPAKQLREHLVAELLTQTPLCPAEGRRDPGKSWGSWLWDGPTGQTDTALHRERTCLVPWEITAGLGGAKRVLEAPEGTFGTQGWPRCELVPGGLLSLCGTLRIPEMGTVMACGATVG